MKLVFKACISNCLELALRCLNKSITFLKPEIYMCMCIRSHKTVLMLMVLFA